MSFPNISAQQSYDRYHDLGLQGMIAKIQNNVYFFDLANVDSGIASNFIPGQAGFINASGNWVRPINATQDVESVTHILGFEKNDLNQPLSPIVENATSSITYEAGYPGVKGLAEGAIVVKASENILKGDGLVYSSSLDGYIFDSSSNRKLLIIALEAASTDELFRVRINRIS